MQRKRQELYNSGAVDDSRMDKLLITGLVAVRPLGRFSSLRTIDSPVAL